jgi:hypothetical protein
MRAQAIVEVLLAIECQVSRSCTEPAGQRRNPRPPPIVRGCSDLPAETFPDNSAVGVGVRARVDVSERHQRGPGGVVGQPQERTEAPHGIQRVGETGDVETSGFWRYTGRAEHGRESGRHSGVHERSPVDVVEWASAVTRRVGVVRAGPPVVRAPDELGVNRRSAGLVRSRVAQRGCDSAEHVRTQRLPS